MLLEKVYEELRNMWLVESQYEFSRFWLGQSRSYMSCAKARQRPPSLLVLMRLSQRLASISAKYAAVATTEMEVANAHKLRELNGMVGEAVGQQAA
ncbi:hypothetical protein H261_21054 [Paramagnetospirillum caucaseum]|uniref:Uncharacterized protein n=1 Tax=Paramagnetospirillum caucaseum TaxID=1244869 RepID=M2Y4B5_9PROT|nr:DUF6626 family protein [Paramagnetospirillum caucaseum]EME67931.1 hypothetical protein H261_21054 [Paramagnetospirillum caucaseum]